MNDVKVHDLEFHVDARGWVNPMVYGGMGHIAYCYGTAAWPGKIKAWHRHAEHTDRLWCVQGMARVVVVQERIVYGRQGDSVLDISTSGSIAPLIVDRFFDFQEFVVGPLSPKVVVIPPGWWHGFTPVGGEMCVVMNAPDMAYDPDDEERLATEAIPFDWRNVDG